MKSINENEIVKSIRVLTLDYIEINLMEKYRAKPILAIIYNNQCLGCTGRAIPLAYRYKQEFDKLQVIGIHSNFGTSKTTKEDIYSIFTSEELPFPIFLDENHKVYDLFNAEGTPQWLLIKEDGRLYRSFFGSQEGVQNRLTYAVDEFLA